MQIKEFISVADGLILMTKIRDNLLLLLWGMTLAMPLAQAKDGVSGSTGDIYTYGRSFGGPVGMVDEAMRRVRKAGVKIPYLFTISLRSGEAYPNPCRFGCNVKDVTEALRTCNRVSDGKCRILAIHLDGKIEQVHFPELPDLGWE